MRRASRRRLQGQPDRLGDLVIADLARPARPRLVVKPVETLFGETPPPLADRVLHRPNAMGDRLVVQPRGRQQDDVRALRQALGRAPAPRQRSEEHTSELQSLMRSSYAVFCLKKTTK